MNVPLGIGSCHRVAAQSILSHWGTRVGFADAIPLPQLGSQPWCWTELFTSREEFLWMPVSFLLYKCAPLRPSVCCLSDAHSLSPAFAASFPSFTATSRGLSTHSTSQLGRAMPFFLKWKEILICMYMHRYHRHGDADIFLSIMYHLILCSQNFPVINLQAC